MAWSGTRPRSTQWMAAAVLDCGMVGRGSGNTRQARDWIRLDARIYAAARCVTVRCPNARPMAEAIPMQKLRKAPATDPGVSYRIGAVSRLAEVPVSTLRVWERRYSAFRPAKSERQHRLYSEADVIKARLLRQLTGAGHGIGTIAHLDANRLQPMLAQARAGQGRTQEAPAVSVAIVGAALAARLNASAWQATYLGRALDARLVFADLDAVEAQAALHEAAGGSPDVLLVQCHELRASVVEQLARVIPRMQARQAIVLYRYGAPDAVEALRGAALIVRRDPVSDEELAELIRSQVMVDATAAIASMQTGALIPPRRFTDAML